ncbi:MAG: DUF4838 domain-containing protein [Kiritimatiellae bacterium]|nr:DUF4838 domain-containing protein [Kiritimatiellia bacterium]
MGKSFCAFAVGISISVLAELVAAPSFADEFILAERGKPAECAIVVAGDAGECVQYAAQELRRFVCETTGVELPVVASTTGKAVVLATRGTGNGERGTGIGAQPLNADAFRIAVSGDRLLIEGGGERGVLYGVYEVLERFAGCRWYSSWHSRIPRLDRIALPNGFDESQVPAFEMREPFWYDVRRHPEFEARLRANGHKWGTIAAKYGGDDWRFGKGLAIAHTFGELIPPGEYFAEHPEYYCMLDGKRSTNGPPRGTSWQPCLTNPDVLRIVTSNVLARIRQDPGARFYGVSQQDHGNVCQCPDCSAVNKEEDSQAGTLFRFVNAVAEDVEKEFPDAVVETLAYMWSRKPPAKTRLRRNVIVCICTLGCDFALPIAESEWRGCVDFRRDLKEWSLQNDRIFIWDYTVNYANYTIPYPNVYALAENIRFFHDNNVRYLFSQGDNRGSHADFAELKTWITAKLMWNPAQPLKPLLDDFFVGFYGPAAPFVREWFEETHQLQLKHSASGKHPLTSYLGPESTAITDDAIDLGVELWRRAEEAVAGDPALSFNVRMTRLSFDCLRLWRLVARLEKRSDNTPIGDVREIASSIMVRLEEDRNLVLSENPKTDAELRGKILRLAAGE